MTKFISVKERRSERAQTHSAPTRTRPRGYEEPFSEDNDDGEDDGMAGTADRQMREPEPAAPVVDPWMPHDVNVDQIRSLTPRLNGQPGGRIVLKNEKNIITVESHEELRELLRHPWEV